MTAPTTMTCGGCGAQVAAGTGGGYSGASGIVACAECREPGMVDLTADLLAQLTGADSRPWTQADEAHVTGACNCGATTDRLHRFDCPAYRELPNVRVGVCAACGRDVPSGTHPDSPNRAVRRAGGQLFHHCCAPAEGTTAPPAVFDAKGDQVPAVGWRQAAARNRVDGALAVALAAVRVAQEVADAEQQHLPTDVWDRCSGNIGAAYDSLGDAEHQLRTKGGA